MSLLSSSNRLVIFAGGLAFAISVGSSSLANTNPVVPNNAPGTTPTFTVTVTTPTTPGITVESTPEGSTITTTPGIQAAVNTVVNEQTTSTLLAVLNSVNPTITVITATTPVDVIFTSGTGIQTAQVNAGNVLTTVANQPIVPGTVFTISSTTSNVSATITIVDAATIQVIYTASTATSQVVPGLTNTFATQAAVLQVASIAAVPGMTAPTSRTLRLTSTPATQVAVLQVASIAVATGMTEPTLQAAVALVNAGAPTVEVINLMLALQTLLNPATGIVSINALNSGINAFNSIVQKSTDAQLTVLNADSTFIAARELLAKPRAAIK